MADDNVIEGGFISRLPVPVEKILRGVNKKHEEDPFARVLVIAVTESDMEPKYWFSDPDGGTAMWDMELLKAALVKVATSD